jgi:hypothetical protein
VEEYSNGNSSTNVISVEGSTNVSSVSDTNSSQVEEYPSTLNGNSSTNVTSLEGSTNVSSVSDTNSSQVVNSQDGISTLGRIRQTLGDGVKVVIKTLVDFDRKNEISQTIGKGISEFQNSVSTEMEKTSVTRKIKHFFIQVVDG